MSSRSFVSHLSAALLAIVFTVASPVTFAGNWPSNDRTNRSSRGGTDSGGGAGCKDENGRTKTLYYCGAYKGTPPAPVAPPSKPGLIDGPSEKPTELDALVSFISNFKHLKKETRAEL